MWVNIRYNNYDDEGKHTQPSVYIEANSLREAVEKFEENFYDVKKRDILSVFEEEPEGIRQFNRRQQLDEEERQAKEKKRKQQLKERNEFLKSLSTKELAAFLRREEDRLSREEFEREGYL